jgi:hypothetical protein
MTDDEPLEFNPDQVEELLERLVEQNPGTEIDLERLGAVLADLWAHVTKPEEPFSGELRELSERGAHLFTHPVDEDGMIEVRLGFEDDPKRWPKAHGTSFRIGKLPLAAITRRPSG